ncbi:MAG TPA: 2OG-Fe(II) oxygenase [Pseudomonadales bacterium]|nr:2OG-Fe(II) oxygenase [Pseudomonadales bacterium]
MMLDAHAIADALCQQGWWVGQDAIDRHLSAALHAEAGRLQQTGAMHAAMIGRGNTQQHNTTTRSDRIHWLDAATDAQQLYLGQMETLRCGLNRELMLGLFEFEAHFACYPPGAFYKKHVDSFVGSASRLVSVVSYLNRDWPAGSGGELLLFSEDGESEMSRVVPQAGTVAIFLSEKIPHAVEAATRERYSIAGWFRVNASSGQRIDVMT